MHSDRLLEELLTLQFPETRLVIAQKLSQISVVGAQFHPFTNGTAQGILHEAKPSYWAAMNFG